MKAMWWTRAVAIGATVAIASGMGALAQGNGAPPPGEGPREGGMQGGPAPENRPKPPIETALDANGDGVIDAAEIANAAVALKKLDKNGDGKLTPDEYRPPHPPRPEGPGR
jgi:hypothetical protein